MNKIILTALLLITGTAMATETTERLLVLVDGLPMGEMERPNCDLRQERCKAIPSWAVGKAVGIDRDCGYVSVKGLATCLGVKVHANVEDGVIFISTDKNPGFRS